MNDLLFNINKTCAVSGHRTLDKDFDRDKLKETFINAVEDGYDTFLVGMAIGFDTECFDVLYGLKGEYGIKIIACIPCPTQDYKFNKKQKEKYDEMLSLVDDKILISREYNNKCMQLRNLFMVKNSSLLIAYLKHDYGGTYYTVNQAKKHGLKIIYV